MEKSSAVLGLGSSEVRVPCPNADHSSICKFAFEDEDYEFIMDEIEALVVWAVNSTGNDSVNFGKSSTASSDSESRSFQEVQNNAGSYFDEDDQLSLENAIMLPKDPPEVNRQARRGPFFLVPYERNSQFVGRQDILYRLNQFSDPSNPLTNFALYGLGGVGKTQIALAHAYWHWVNYPEQSVFWILASDANQLCESLGLIGAHCRISRVEDTVDIMLDRVRRWLSDENNGRWLMIIDGADKIDTWLNPPGDFQLGGAQAVKSFPAAILAQYVPTCSHGKVLIAANNKLTAESLVHTRHVLEVQPMETHDACTLLRKYLKEEDDTSGSIKNRQEPLRNDDLVKLASQLDFLPMALVQAAAYIRMHSLSVRYFLQVITIDQSNIKSVSKTDLHAPDGLEDLSEAFMAIWRVAFDQVEAHCTSAADLLSIVAFYEIERIPKDLFSHLHTSTSKMSSLALDTLLAYSFITMDSENETFSIPRLVQLAMRQRLSAYSIEKKWADEALILISQKFPDGEYESWPICAKFIPHSLKLLRSDLYGPTEARPLGILEFKISQYYVRRGLFQQAEIWSGKALENIILVPGMDLKEVFGIKSNRITVLLKLGAFDEAEDLAQEVWRGRKTTSGAKHEDTLQTVAILALIHQQQGRYEKGETAIRKILKSLGRTLEADDIQIIAVKQRLGIILRHLGRFKEAQEYQLAAIQGYIKKLGSRHPDTLKAHWILGQLYHAMGLYAEAEKIDMDNWTLQKRDDMLGPDHPDTLFSQHGLANNFQAQFKFLAAESHKREIYRKATIIVGYTHVYTLVAGSSLASCLVASNMYANQPSAERLAEAEDLYRHTLTTREANLRPDHPNTLAARTDLTVVQRLRGQTHASELEASERETLNKLKRTLDKNHPLTVNSRDNLSRILWLQQGDNSKRKEALKKAMQLFTFWEKNSGWSHQRTWLAAELLVEILPESDEQVLDLTQKIHQRRRNQPTIDQV